MRKMVMIIIFALFLLLFCGVALVCAGQRECDKEELQRQIETVINAHEGIKFVPAGRVIRTQIARAVVKYADEYRLNPWLVLGVISAESAGNPDAVNGNCWGLMQVDKCLWFAEIARDLPEVDAQVKAGCAVLRYYLDKHSGDTERALKSYGGYTRNKGRKYVLKCREYEEAINE